jgi:glycopeptide antibiotics resistance protein
MTDMTDSFILLIVYNCNVAKKKDQKISLIYANFDFYTKQKNLSSLFILTNICAYIFTLLYFIQFGSVAGYIMKHFTSG